MQKSTPLDHLRRDEEPDPEARDMMDSIVQDLEGGGTQGLPPSQQQGPPPQHQHPHPHPHQQQPMPGYHPGQGGPPPGFAPEGEMGPEHFQGGPPHLGYGGGGGPPPPPPGYGPRVPPGMHPGMMGGGGGGGLEKATLAQKVMAQAKEPLLVSVLVVILSSSQVQQLIVRFLPMASGNPFIGLLVRATVAGLAFYLLRRFIPN